LGSIYEGILEYRLKVADQELVAVKEKGREVWLPKGQASTKKAVDHVTAGSVYLVTDKGERKATGSYYTPDYIVKYIAENTLRPLIEPLARKAMFQEDGLIRKLLPKRLLSLKVLDPAMGSGTSWWRPRTTSPGRSSMPEKWPDRRSWSRKT
jgi:type I restriction-modification system DNA methylase subunit